MMIFFFKQKTAYEMRISDWSSDVCSSDLGAARIFEAVRHRVIGPAHDIERRLEILLGLAGEANDEVARNRDVGACFANAFDDAKIAVDAVAAVHRREDAEIGRESCRERV